MKFFVENEWDYGSIKNKGGRIRKKQYHLVAFTWETVLYGVGESKILLMIDYWMWHFICFIEHDRSLLECHGLYPI